MVGECHDSVECLSTGELHGGWGSALSKPVEKAVVIASCDWATVSLGDVCVLPVLHAAAVTATVAKSAMRGATRVTKLTSLKTSSRVRGYRRQCHSWIVR